jgi:aquaporin Z
MFMEMVLTAGLFSVILGTASKSQNLGPISAIAVGFYVVLAGLWSSPISGASMNPARSFGPDLVLGNFDHYWVYVVGPLVGAGFAIAFAYILRGRADIGGAAAAQGGLGELEQQVIQDSGADPNA